MIIWIVQFRRTRRALAEARIFTQWGQALWYANSLGTGKKQLYMKPILFSATVRGDK